MERSKEKRKGTVLMCLSLTGGALGTQGACILLTAGGVLRRTSDLLFSICR